jgi:hypothetical protein
VYIGFRGAALLPEYEGRVVFRGRGGTGLNSYEFDAPALAADAGAPSVAFIEGGPNLFAEPAVGQEFWLSYSRIAPGVLRESQQGPIVLVTGTGILPPAGAFALETVLGVGVTLERSCAYTSTIDLWDVVFDTSPPVRVKSGTIGSITIAGRAYRVWLWSQSDFKFIVFPAS